MRFFILSLLALSALVSTSVLAASGATVYQHCDYAGHAATLRPGRYDLGDLQRRGVRNDDLSAIRVAKGYEAILYEHAGFRGRKLVLRANDKCFVNNNFNDVVSSIVVRQLQRPAPAAVAKVFQHCNFDGYAVSLPPGRYDLNELQRRGMRNDDLSAIQVARGFEVVLFEHAGFRGRRLAVRGNDNCFVNDGFNDLVSSIVVQRVPGAKAQAAVYQHCDFGGYQAALRPGRYDLGALKRLGVRNDDLSAIRVNAGYEVIAYEHAGFRGRSITFRSNDKCLVNNGFNDVISSVVVRKAAHQVAKAQVFKHCDFKGHSAVLGPGRYRLADLRRLGIVNDDLSSVRVPRGLEVILYEHDNFAGATQPLRANESCLTRHRFNDVVSSIVVRRVR